MRESITVVLIPQKHNPGWEAGATVNKVNIVASGETATLALENFAATLRRQGL